MKKILVVNLLLIFIILIFSSAYAANENVNLNTSSDSAVEGKTFTVTIEASADNNITGLQCDLEYDTNKLSIQSKSAGTGFSDLSGTGEIAIVSTDSESLSKSGTLYTITFKVLEEAEIGETTISVKSVILALINENSEQENANIEDDGVVINIKADEEQDNPDEEKEPEILANNVNSDNNISSNKNTSENDNKNTIKLPQTGVKNIRTIAVTILVGVSLIAYITYIKYKKI